MPHDREKIASLVKSGRLTKGYTQLELSNLTRISLRSIQRIENGNVAPRSYTLNILAGQLGFDPAEALIAEQLNESKPVTGEPVKNVNHPRNLILSFGAALLLMLGSAAFLSQSKRFPETNFESFSFWAIIVLGYMLILWRVWK